MELDMYGEKVANAAQLVRDLTGGEEWFNAFDRNTQHTLELFIAAMDKVKDDILASLPSTAAPVLSDDQRKKLEYIANWMDSSVRIIQNAPDDYGPASQFDYDMGQAAHEILSILAATRSQP